MSNKNQTSQNKHQSSPAANLSNPAYAGHDLQSLIENETMDFLLSLPDALYYNPQAIRATLLEKIYIAIDLENSVKSKNEKFRIPGSLSEWQVEQILIHCYRVVRLGNPDEPPTGKEPVAVYLPEVGIYSTNDSDVYHLIRLLNNSENGFSKRKVYNNLQMSAPIVATNTDPNLILLANGVLHMDTKALEGYSPDVVFTSKARVNWNPGIVMPTITQPDGTVWTPEDLFGDLSDDPEIVNLLWLVVGAALQPHRRWGQAVFFYNVSGCNGKGTLIQLLTNILGDKSIAKISLTQFENDNCLEQVTRVQLIMADENSTRKYLDNFENFKALVTGDSVEIVPKYRMPVRVSFAGLIVQCTNSVPAWRDRTESLYRRLLPIPFEKCFTGNENKSIKGDYIYRQEVLEYIVYRALMMDYDHFPEKDKLPMPASCRALLDYFQDSNDPVREFVHELLPLCQWYLLPYTYLYDLFKAFHAEAYPSSPTISRRTFIESLLTTVKNDPRWVEPNNHTQYSSKGRMEIPEHLIIRYQLRDWMNPNYTGSDPDQICRPAMADRYRGLLRSTPTVIALPEATATDTPDDAA